MSAAAISVFDSSSDVGAFESDQTTQGFSAKAGAHLFHAPLWEDFTSAISEELDSSPAKLRATNEQPAQTSKLRSSAFEYSFVAEQEWEGCVTWFDGKEFHAHLLDLTNDGVEEEAVFDISEISSIHQDLLKEGALFRWSIGYLRQKGGTRSRLSSLVFRRLPAWSSLDLQRSKKEADDLLADLQWD